MTNGVRVLIVDDDALVRAGLTMMLDGADGISVVGEAADGDAALVAVAEHAPDVVLMDIQMPTMDGVTATGRIRARGTQPTAVIVLTTFDTDENILRALHAGADGFLLKDTPPAQIVAAVQRVASGDPILSPQVTRKLMNKVTSDAGNFERARAAFAKLSEREHEVAMAVASGKPNADIAAALYMSVPTVKAHVSHILTKLDLDNRTQIALAAHDAGLT
ncbi:DNA-binding NarL/FixJ family response regulator [Nocardia transvalensis]|uniref:DNA-binding NarL/FixJ family response regulator n=1 Tax=Nocardia transvalensis TaxID=37333 RepID=A0A7W9PM95_9NOCA|nr:response regulator transcription factor [Nocardia transvalensis]MBB5918239.1 DNA-binding NarL/FixJ family response regulator [Nocardia transvalensis]